MTAATAGKALLGSTFTLTPASGRPVDSQLAELVTATAHPSSILRAPDDESRRAARQDFTGDLQTVARFLANGRG